ncbi:hypothetical protein ONV78_29020 [Hahella sp. CR1]|uniref:hypothetical protein n=1 Tax=Hahella sp. CR1 TaxID=2992807 RepID=UPI00244273F0|nr:hypothetical protein [Hahella sp. CR1]MDG9671813.1 hypothetical protein [Hahella sp. CR1]
MYVEYTARRFIAPGHVAGGNYWIDVKLTRCDFDAQIEAQTTTALSGKSKTLLHRIDQTYDIATVYMNQLEQLAEMREFLGSVSGGESFMVSLHGDRVSPLQPAMLDPITWKEERYGTTDYFRYTFKVRVA